MKEKILQYEGDDSGFYALVFPGQEIIHVGVEELDQLFDEYVDDVIVPRLGWNKKEE